MTRHLDWRRGLLDIVVSINSFITTKGSCVLVAITGHMPIITAQFGTCTDERVQRPSNRAEHSWRTVKGLTEDTFYCAFGITVLRSARTGRGCETSTSNRCQDVKVIVGAATGDACLETATVWSWNWFCIQPEVHKALGADIEFVFADQPAPGKSLVQSFMINKNYKINTYK